MALPANVSFGTVTGRFLTATADSPTDPDRDPEGTPATDLKVTFSPNLMPAVVRDASASPPAVFALADVAATVGAAGDLVGPDGQAGIRLVATTGPALDPAGWTWKVTLSSPTFPALSFSFSLDPGQSVDLASVVQVPTAPGATLAAWLQAVADAQAARDAAEAAAAAIPSDSDYNMIEVDTVTSRRLEFRNIGKDQAGSLSSLIHVNDSTIGIASGGKITSKSFDFPCDVSVLNNQTAGDRANNTNGALSCGVGLVVYTGTAWKNLITGATY